jgi:hypothetical protein
MTERFIEVPSTLQLRELLSGLWVLFDRDRRALYRSWQEPGAQVPDWYVRAGWPAPPTSDEGLDYSPRLRRWV